METPLDPLPELLRLLAAFHGPLDLSLTANGWKVTLQVRPVAPDPPTGAVPPAAVAPYLFSPLERRVVQALAGGPLKAVALARRLDLADGRGEANTELRGVLKQLLHRGVLANDEAGYRVTAGFLATATGTPAPPAEEA